MAGAELVVTLAGKNLLSGVMKAATGDVKDFGSAVTGVAGKGLSIVGGIAATTAKVGLAAVAGASIAVAAGLTSAVKTAASFEQQMANIKAVSGATGDEFASLRDLALKLGEDTRFSATDAAAGIEELVKGGLSIKDILGGAASGALNLAAAGGTSLAEAANIAAVAIAAFGLKGSDMSHVADLIAGAANASTISVRDFQLSLSQAAAVAATAGISFDETAQTIALLGKKGLIGSDAGTSFKQFIAGLTPTTKTAVAALTKLGIVTADGKNQFFDAKGELKDMAQIAELLRKGTAKLTTQQKLQALETIFGSDAIRAAAIIAEAGAKGFKDLGKAMEGVTAADVARERMNTLEGAIEELGGAWEKLKIEIGTAFLPVVRRVAESLTDLIKGLNKSGQATAFFETAADALLTFIGALAGDWGGQASDNINPIVQAFGNLGLFIRNVAIPAISSFVRWMAGPGTAAALTFGKFFQTEILPRLQQFGAFLQTEILPRLQEFGNWFITVGVPAIQKFADFIGAEVLPKVQAFGAWLSTEGLAAAKAFGDWFQSDGVPLLDSFKGLSETVGGILKDIVGPAMNTVAANGGAILEKVGPLVDAFKDLLEALRPLGQLLGAAFGAIASALPGLLTQLTGFINTLTGTIQLVKALVGGLSAAFSALGRGDAAGALAIIQGTMEEVAAATAKVADGQKQVAAGAAQTTAGQAAFAQGIGIGPQAPTTQRPPMMAGPPAPTQEEIERVRAHAEAMAAFVAQAQLAGAALGAVTHATGQLAPSMKKAAAHLIGPY